MTKETCATCRFYRQHDDGDHGNCWFNPPTVLTYVMHQDTGGVQHWANERPYVAASDFCGHHRPPSPESVPSEMMDLYGPKLPPLPPYKEEAAVLDPDGWPIGISRTCNVCGAPLWHEGGFVGCPNCTVRTLAGKPTKPSLPAPEACRGIDPYAERSSLDELLERTRAERR